MGRIQFIGLFLYSSHHVLSISNEIKDYVTCIHELVQLLHHAYVYDFKRMLLLIGDDKANVIRGIWLNISSEIRSSYGHLLQFIFDMALKWAYDGILPAEKNLDEELSLIKGLDLQSFLTHYSIWRQVTTKLPAPLPALERIIPRVFSAWNSVKGGSDTTTKLLWQVKQGHLIPCDSSQVCSIFAFYMCTCVILCN